VGILELEIASAVPRGQNNDSSQNGARQVNKSWLLAQRLTIHNPFRGPHVGLRRGDPNSLIGDGPGRPLRPAHRIRGDDVTFTAHLPATMKRRKKIFAEFIEFAHGRNIDMTTLLDGERVRPVADALVLFGNWLYRSERSRGDLAELLNHVSELREDWRPLLGAARKVNSRWKHLEPTQHHAPAPVELVAAMCVLGCLSTSPRFVLVLLCGYFGGLRPEDMLSLRKKSFVFPNGASSRFCFIVIGGAAGSSAPKTARTGGAQTQHVRISEPLVLRVLSWALDLLAPDDPIWPWSKQVFRTRWNSACEFFNVAANDANGFTPASLRAGAASALYEANVALTDIKWFLRHNVTESGPGSLGHYIQELPAAMIRAGALPPRVLQFAECLRPALEELMEGNLLSPVHIGAPRAPQPRPAPPPRNRHRPQLTAQLGSHLDDGGYWQPLTS
jgi:hypothetical protein